MIRRRSFNVTHTPGEVRATRSRGFAFAVGVLLVILALSAYASAQVTGGTISGTVTDPSTAAVPGATVTVTNLTKGEKRTVTANGSGFYSVPNLVPGRYDVTVTAEGFAGAVQKDLLIEVGQEVSANVQLQVGNVSEQVVVESGESQIATTTSTLSNVVGGQVVRDLPINGRDWTLLAALEPGVHTIEAQSAISTSGNARANRGFGTQMTIAGNRPQQNNYRLDGVSINDYSGSGPGNVIGSALGVDAVQEFSVVTGNASADYGKTSGGVINAVTRSGQNQFHGSAYEFLRNSALDARNYFDGSTVPPFKRNQFGFSIGGPVYLPHFGEGGPLRGYNGKNRTFFFADYEGLRQDLGTTTILNVPSRAARAGQLAGGAVTVNPLVRPFLNLFPLPNGGENGDTGTFSFSSQAVTTENLFTARLDHRFSDADSLNAVFLTDPSEDHSPDSYNFTQIGQTSARKSVSIEETHIFRPNLINVARIGYSRSVVAAPITLGAINPLATDTSLGFLPGSPVGNFSITGISIFTGGVGAVGETDYHYGSFQAYDDVLLTKGNHSLKFGVAGEYIQSNEFAGGDQLGRYTFGSLRSFLLNQPTSFNAVVPGQNSPIYLRQKDFGAYAQDDYKVRPNLTLNLGLRYEMATVPTEKFNHLTNLTNLTSAQPRIGSPYFENPTLRDFSPRLGFAWDPFKDGKTSLRGGFGIYDTLPLTYQFGLLVVNANPFSLAGSVTSPTLPTGSFPTGGFPRLTANTQRFSYVEPNPRRSYVEQWNLNVQRQLPAGIVLLVGYIGEHGVHQPFRTNDANIVLPTVAADGSLVWPTPRASGTPLNPNVGVINALAWQASNTYHGMNVGVTRQKKGLRLGLSYTWSKSLDNSSASIAGGTFNTDIQAPFLFFPQLFRGLSSFDVRQNLTFNYLWEIPRPGFAREGVLRQLTGGWQLGGIFHARTGLPFTVTTGGDSLGLRNANAFNFPDRVNTPDCATAVNPGNPAHYIKTECFVAPTPVTRLGNSGRNQLIGPSMHDFDLSLIKNTNVGERLKLQFRAEFFNVFNWTNFSVPDRTSAQLFSFSTGTNAFSRVASAGALNSTSTSSRQIQFALKLTF
jgi:hypothetical protein